MTTRVLRHPYEIDGLARYLRMRDLPLTVSIRKGVVRSLEQNSLQHKWLQEIAAYFEDRTPEEVRGYCKLEFGIPIRCEEDDYRELWTQASSHLTYEQKLKLMMVPFDIPCTRDMTTKQKTRYLDAVYTHFTGMGMVLTRPNEDLESYEQLAKERC